jgi:ABC-2 type transport system ATP-binding protein
MEMPVIEMNKTTKYYDKTRGIEDLDLKVQEGDIFGFIGPNGAGKSTTIRILMNFIFPTSGSARIFGQDVTKNSQILRKDIGYMPSDVFFHKSLKVREILDYSCLLRGIKDKKTMNQLTEAFELDTGKKFEDLSFGNKKKVSIVQSLLHKPKLLILDEPTGGLDPLVQKTFFEYINSENKRGVTVFFSSHTLSEVQKMCKNVGIIKDGRMIQVEEIDSIRSKQLKKVNIDSFDDLKPEIFKGDNFRGVYINKNSIEFYYKGDINKLVKILGEINLRSFTMKEPELEEVFIHYYSDGGDE